MPVGALWKETAATVIDGQSLITVKEITEFDEQHRPIETQLTLPTHAWLGDLSGMQYTSEVDYDAAGRVVSETLPAVGGLDEHTISVDRDVFGITQTVDVTYTSGTWTLQADAQVDAFGLLQQRVLGNGVTRTVSWQR